MVINPQHYTPGSVVKVWSPRFLCFHWGVIDWPSPFNSEVKVIHSAKGSFVRSTTMQIFSEGQTIEVTWVPQTQEQQYSVLQRIHTLDGQPYDVFAANCEHVVNWAVTGKSYSPQLAVVIILAVVAAGLAIVSARK